MATADAYNVFSRRNEMHSTDYNDDNRSESRGKYSFIGQEWRYMPVELCQSLAKDATHLDLSFNRLTCLSGLHEFSLLQELILDNNQLPDETEFPALKTLSTLTLNNNKFSDLDRLLTQLRDRLPQLSYLSLLGNTACPSQLSGHHHSDDDYRRYRTYVLHHLPHLKFLDSSIVRKTERLDAKRQGRFLKVVRPAAAEATDVDSEKGRRGESRGSIYTPLPESQRTQPIATLGQTRYIYYGKHSEGNRFIKNNDL